MHCTFLFHNAKLPNTSHCRNIEGELRKYREGYALTDFPAVWAVRATEFPRGDLLTTFRAFGRSKAQNEINSDKIT